MLDVLDGHQLTGDGIGNLICGWAITSKDGSPMNMGAWSALATDKVRYVGDAVAVVIAETRPQARIAAEAVDVSITGDPARGRRPSDKALAGGAPQIHDNAPGNLIYDWEMGDEDRDRHAALAGAAHVTEIHLTNNRLSPNAMEPRSASPSSTRPRIITRSTPPARTRMWRGWCSAPSTTWRPSTSLRVIAPDVGGGFGSKIYIYPEEITCLWASMKIKRPRSSGPPTARRPS